MEAENRAVLETDGDSSGSSNEGLKAGTYKSLCFRELVSSHDFKVHFNPHKPTLLYLSAEACSCHAGGVRSSFTYCEKETRLFGRSRADGRMDGHAPGSAAG